jgi:hypothetical protein
MALTQEDLSETLLDQLAAEASLEAIGRLQRKGINIVYCENDLDVLEHPDGSRFQIEYLPGLTGEYRIVCALPARA